MKKLLLLAAAALLLLPVHAQAYTISYVIDSTSPNLDYTASVTGGNTLSFFANTTGANYESQITGKYWITADAGESATLASSVLDYSQSLKAVCNDDIKEVKDDYGNIVTDGTEDITASKISVSRPWAFSTGTSTWDTDPSVKQSSFIGDLTAGTMYDFFVQFTNLASGYGEASFSLTVPQNAATPIPGAVWLLGSGMVGLVGLRRKMKN